MKLRNMWKRFWTLDVHNHAGFTLVELIIVIAILAILSTGAIAGYSAYVEKANKTADKAMIAELETVLSLAIYNGEINGNGYIDLSVDGVMNAGKIEGTALETVLRNAYGENWDEALKLKYADWKPEHMNVSGAEAEYVGNSSYLNGERSDVLLQDVESFTNMAANLAEVMGSTSGGTTLTSLFGQDLLNETAEKYGIDTPEDGDWDAWGQSNPQALSNLLVLATANDSQKIMAGESATAESTNLILQFSTFYAFAATCPEFSDTLDQYMADLDNVTSPSEGAAWYRELEAEAKKAEYKNANGEGYAEYLNTTAESDQIAFVAIMSALNNASAEDVSNNISSATLFTDGAVKDMYDQYMSAVDVMIGTDADELEDGCVRISFNTKTMEIVSTIAA